MIDDIHAQFVQERIHGAIYEIMKAMANWSIEEKIVQDGLADTFHKLMEVGDNVEAISGIPAIRRFTLDNDE